MFVSYVCTSTYHPSTLDISAAICLFTFATVPVLAHHSPSVSTYLSNRHSQTHTHTPLDSLGRSLLITFHTHQHIIIGVSAKWQSPDSLSTILGDPCWHFQTSPILRLGHRRTVCHVRMGVWVDEDAGTQTNHYFRMHFRRRKGTGYYDDAIFCRYSVDRA
jgi:hypothetical protein